MQGKCPFNFLHFNGVVCSNTLFSNTSALTSSLFLHGNFYTRTPRLVEHFWAPTLGASCSNKVSQHFSQHCAAFPRDPKKLSKLSKIYALGPATTYKRGLSLRSARSPPIKTVTGTGAIQRGFRAIKRGGLFLLQGPTSVPDTGRSVPLTGPRFPLRGPFLIV